MTNASPPFVGRCLFQVAVSMERVEIQKSSSLVIHVCVITAGQHGFKPHYLLFPVTPAPVETVRYPRAVNLLLVKTSPGADSR